MKNRLYLWLTGFFLIFLAVGFFVVSTLTSRLVYHTMETREAEKLHREALIISENYVRAYYSNELTLEEFYSHMSALDSYLEAEIWVINRSGRVLLDSSSPLVTYNEAPLIERFNATDFGSDYYIIGNFYDWFPQNHLTVYAPVTRNYNLIGYVLIHEPLEEVVKYSNRLLNISYITWGIIGGLAFVLVVLVSALIVHPIRRIARMAAQYAGGEFDRKIEIHQDSEIGQLAASLNFMANEMNTLEEDQRKFISNISHDFRSPLTSIRGYVDAMLDGTIPPEMQPHYLKTILFETERLTKLTSGILELNKYGAHGRTILDVTSFDINQTIKQTVRAFEGICIEKRITFELVLTDNELLVSADMSKIQQVLYNLLDNAIKFSHHDSSIRVETTLKNEKVFVSVKDHGIGIPKESIGKIFERFYKSDSSRGKDKKGTGLGLSIVKEIIQAHNENINVISTEGVGTEFIFSLHLSVNDKD